MQIEVQYRGEDRNLRQDLKNLRDAHNQSEVLLELESKTADPSVTASSDKVYVWYRSDLNEIRANNNGTVYKVALTAA